MNSPGQGTQSFLAADFIARKVESACFIPGFYGGKATDMSYSEMFTD